MYEIFINWSYVDDRIISLKKATNGNKYTLVCFKSYPAVFCTFSEPSAKKTLKTAGLNL